MKCSRKGDLNLQVICRWFCARRPQRKQTNYFTRKVLYADTQCFVCIFTLMFHCLRYYHFRFSVTLNGVNEDMEVILSSNPESPQPPVQDELVCHSKESKLEDPCQESFSKMTLDQMNPGSKSNGNSCKIKIDKSQMSEGNWNLCISFEELLLPEEMLVVDFLPHFKKHFPTLKDKLSRLRTFPVADPLRSLAGAWLEESMLRWESAAGVPPDIHSSTLVLFRHCFIHLIFQTATFQGVCSLRDTSRCSLRCRSDVCKHSWGVS